MDGALVCGECQGLASDFCCCDYPPALVCALCVQRHRERGVDEVHLFFPTSDLWKVQTQTDCVKAQCKAVRLKAAEGRIMKNIAVLEKCESDLAQAFDFALMNLQRAKESRLRALSDLKSTLISTIKDSLETVKSHLLNKTFIPDNDVIREISEFGPHSEITSLSLFRYSVDEDKITNFAWEEGLGVVWEVGLINRGNGVRVCEQCGVQVDPGWQANGRTLCAACRGPSG